MNSTATQCQLPPNLSNQNPLPPLYTWDLYGCLKNYQELRGGFRCHYKWKVVKVAPFQLLVILLNYLRKIKV